VSAVPWIRNGDGSSIHVKIEFYFDSIIELKMEHQDWKTVVLRKSEKKVDRPRAVGHKKISNLDSDDPDAPKTMGLSAGKQIQSGRCAKKLSQKELAQKINVKPQVISDYESGKAIPNRAILNKLNRVLDIKIC